MADAYFRRVEVPDDSGDTGSDSGTQWRRARFLAGESTAGPWSPRLQHGGPPNALAVVLADEAVRAAGRTDLVPMRLASDFVGPVPVGEIESRASVVRLARSAALCSVELVADGRTCLSARIWFVRDADTTAQATAVDPAPPPPATDDGPPATGDDGPVGFAFGYGTSLRWVFLAGAAGVPGPASVWVLPQTPLLAPTETLPGLARVALVADSSSGVSAELDWAHWSFVNVDLDIHLSRPLVGQWVHLDARTTIGAHGSALAEAVIGDEAGVLGRSLQTLVVAPAAPSMHGDTQSLPVE